MNRDAKLYGGIIVIVAGLYLAKSTFDNSGLNDLFVLSALLGGIGIAARLVKDKKVKQHLQRFSEDSKGVNYGFKDCKEIAKEWSKEEYQGRIKGKKGMSFDWSQAKTDIAPVYDFSDDDWIHARYFYTQYGPNNKGTLIFIDATNGRFMTSMPVHKHNLKDDPFMHLEMYRMTKRFASRITHSDDENHNVQALTGIPIQGNVSTTEGDE